MTQRLGVPQNFTFPMHQLIARVVCHVTYIAENDNSIRTPRNLDSPTCPACGRKTPNGMTA